MISTYAFKDLMILPQTLHLRGVCPQFGTFTINFIDEEGVNLLHFSFRIDQQTLVINENLTGKWGKGQEVADVTFPTGRPFVIRLELAEENAIRVFMDENLLTGFTWRTDIRKASRVDLTDVQFALFREDDTFKTIPDDTSPSRPVPPGIRPQDDAVLSDVLQRLDQLMGMQKEMVDCIGDITGLLADLQKQHQDIAAGIQTLLSRDAKATTDSPSGSEKAA